MSAEERRYFVRLADCGSGWRVCNNRNGVLYQLIGPKGRPRHFKTHEGATRVADQCNAAQAARRAAQDTKR